MVGLAVSVLLLLAGCVRHRRHRRHADDADLHYRIASVTKTFTATAVLEFADQGKLSVGDTLDQYVPGICIRAVLTVAASP